MGASLIQVTSFTPINFGAQDKQTSSVILINPSKIVSVETRATAYNTDGITDILYEAVVNNMRFTINLIVEEAIADILTASNANVIAT